MALARKPFVVIDAEILSSSVWSEAAHVRLVWLTMLILCDTDGYVGASVPGIARAAGVTLEQAREALAKFKEPDPDSRTKTDDGRRIEDADRGFRILNFKEHLDRLSAEKAKTRDRVRKFRERKRQKADGNVTVPVGRRDKGEGNRDVVPAIHHSVVREGVQGEGPRLPANPLIEGRRPTMERQCYALIREISELEPDRDPTEILIEAAGWKDREGNQRSKVRLETMTDDHLIRTLHDLKSIFESAKEGHAKTTAGVQRQS